MEELLYRTTAELEAGFDRVLQSPRDFGTLDMIVRRPEHDVREVLQQAEVSSAEGLVGDLWITRPPKPPWDSRESQVTLMNSRLVALLAGDRERWPLAGDQLYVDLDLSEENLPPGTRLSIGSAVLEVSAKPHTGCKKFVARFGQEALDFISAPERKSLHLRGINARVIREGTIRVGDRIKKS